MKVSIGLLAFCFVLCQATPGWEEGKEYIYDYESRFGTGLIDDVTQLSGRGMKGKLHVCYKNDELAVWFTDLVDGEFNTKMRSVFDVVETNYIKDDEAKDIANHMEHKMWATYKDGMITDSKHTEISSYDYINLKRAVLSLLQIRWPTERSTEHDHYYNVNETSIGGDCETTYVINHRPWWGNPKAEVLNITKNHWYTKCTYRPHEFYSSMDGYRCPHCKEQDFEPFRALGRVDYNIRGNRDKYTIERIYASGKISYTPFTTNGETVASITNQTLFLREIKDTPYPSAPGAVSTVDGLYYVFDSVLMNYDTMDLKKNDNHFTWKEWEIKQAKMEIPKWIERLTPDFSGYGHVHHAVDALLRRLYVLDYEDIDEIVKQYYGVKSTATPDEKNMRNMMMKMMTMLGTSPAVLYTLERIEAGDVPEGMIPEMLRVLPFYVKVPSRPMVERYLKFLKTDVMTKDITSQVSSTGWIGFGTLLYKACIKDDFNPHPQKKDTYMSEDKCRPYIEEIVKRMEAAKTDEEKCVYLRALKNTRSERAFEILTRDVIPNRKYNIFMRATAIWGLEHYVEDRVEEVAEVLMPILTNWDEDYLLRIYAFDILVYYNPTPVFMSNLVLMVNKEPSQQLASYIYSTLANAANTTDPCMEELAIQARFVLPYFIRKDYDVLRHSTNKMLSYYNEQYGFGRTTQINWIASNTTMFPRDWYIRQGANIAGYNFDVMQMGGIQSGYYMYDQILALMMKQYNLVPYEWQTKQGDKFNIAKHFAHEKSMMKQRREYYGLMFDQDVFVKHTSPMDFEGENPYTTKISDFEQELRMTLMMSYQIQYVVPNQVGLPTVLQMHNPCTIKMDGPVKIEKVTGPPLGMVSGLKMNLNVKLGVGVMMNSRMEVRTPSYGSYGYQLNTTVSIKLPIRGEIEYKHEAMEFKIKHLISEEPYDIFNYNSCPCTYTRDGKEKLDIHYSEKPEQKHYKFGHNYFGYGWKIETKYDYNWVDYETYRNFFSTLFHKSSRYEDYYSMLDKWYAGSKGFIQSAMLNPTGRPYSLNIRFERSTSNPANSYNYKWKWAKTAYHDESMTEGDTMWKSKKCDLEIVADGPTKRGWYFTMNYDTHFPETDTCRLKFHYKRTPIPNYDPKEYEVCVLSTSKIEGVKSIIMDPLKRDHGTGVNYMAKIGAGEECSKNEVDIKIKATPTEEQMTMDKEKMQIYKKCREDYSKGYEYSLACWLVKKDQGRLGKYIMDVEYSKGMNPKVKEYFYRMSMWFRHNFYYNMEVDLTPGEVPENHVRVAVNVSYRHPVMDVHVYRPYEIVHYHDVFIPSILPRYSPVTIVENSWKSYMRRMWRYEKPRCYLSGDYIYTLDGVQYKYELGNCYHVAAANKMSENMVLMYKSVKDGKYSKAMKIVFDSSWVEIKPEGGSLTVTVDGDKLPADKKAYISKSASDFAVYKQYAGYKVKSKSYGISVYFDGRNSKITMSNLWRGRQTGLCGDFNGDRMHEFTGLDGKCYSNTAEFAATYAMQGDQC